MAYTYEDLDFLYKAMSGGQLKFYSESRRACGPFAISSDMVEEFGYDSDYTYIPKLEDAPDPYIDFRFDKAQSLAWILKCSEELIIPYRLDILCRALTPYMGLEEMKVALDGFEIDMAQPIQISAAMLCSRIQRQVNSNPFKVVLSNLLRARYFRGLV